MGPIGVGGFLTLALTAIVALALLARRLGIPYPIVFVFGGIFLALIPGMPTIALAPDTVFLLFLPPLIFGDAWTTDYGAFIRYRRPILLLATGLVAFTSVVVAFVAHALIGISLALGFVLGAVLSPTDAVATEAIAEEVGLPRRLASLINGESLINDATGLVIYRFAVVAAATGAFSLIGAIGQFVYVAVVGVLGGLALAWVIGEVTALVRRSGLGDTATSVAISLLTPFALYITIDAIHGSGVLAAMAGGMYLSRKTHRIFDAESRIAAAGVWNFLFFAFNGAAFVLIGLQLRRVVASLSSLGYTAPTLIGWALAISAVVIGVRFVWVFSVSYLRWSLSPSLALEEGPRPHWTSTFVLGLAGMRGIVSLAAALALPDLGARGVRDLLLFLTFAVILVTLVGEGLAMPWFIRRFGVRDDDDGGRGLAQARVSTAEAAREHLRGLEPSFRSTIEWEIVGRVAAEYEQRAGHFATHANGAAQASDEREHDVEKRLRREAYGAERAALGRLRRSGEVSDDVYRTLEWEIDLAESRLE